MYKKKGFTLTELLAVIAIIAILSVAAISGFSAMSNNSKKKALEQKVSQIELAAEKYAKENNLQSTQTISVNKLILIGYLQPDSTTTDGLALLSNPVDNDNLVCNLVTIRISNDEYKAEFVHNQKDCNIAREEIVDSNVDIQVLKYEATEDRDVERYENSNEYEWVNGDVLININSDEYEPKARSITYEYGGNVVSKNIVADKKARTPSQYNEYDETNYNEMLIKDFGQIFNGPINITYNMKDGTTKNIKLIIKIDKEAPIGYSTIANDTSKDSTKTATLFFDDRAGSGIKGYYYSTDKNNDGLYVGEGQNTIRNGDTEITYGNDNGTMKVYKGVYYIRVVDKVDNKSEPILVDVNNFDANEVACSILVYNSAGNTSIERTLKWYNSDIVIRAESVRPTGDYGAKYNFLEGTTTITEANLTETVKPNEKMIGIIKRSAEMDLTDYVAGLKGTSSKNNSLVHCANQVGIDKTKPEATISATDTTTYKKSHNITITITDNRSGFTAVETNKLKFTYGWSTSNTVAPTTNLKEGTATLTDATHASASLTEGSGMTGEYYLWIIGSSVHDKAENYLDNVVSSYKFYFDNTDPTCTHSGDNDTWRQQEVVITWGCYDEHSQCTTDSDKGSNTYSTTTETANIAAYNIADNAGNTVSCKARTASIKVDVTAPTCSIAISDVASSAAVDVTLTHGDSDSNEKTFKFNNGTNATIRHDNANAVKYEGYVQDNALNESRCDITVNRLNYNVGDGNACTYDHKYAVNGGTWGTLCIPTRTDYEFVKWKKADGTEVKSSTTVNGNVDVVAEWKEAYKEGKGSISFVSTTSSATKTYKVTNAVVNSVECSGGNCKCTNTSSVVTCTVSNMTATTVNSDATCQDLASAQGLSGTYIYVVDKEPPSNSNYNRRGWAKACLKYLGKSPEFSSSDNWICKRSGGKTMYKGSKEHCSHVSGANVTYGYVSGYHCKCYTGFNIAGNTLYKRTLNFTYKYKAS